MPRLIVCDRCGFHVKSGDTRCPHCGAEAPVAASARARAGAVLVGIALGGCPASEPEYGVPVTTSDATGESTGSGTEGTSTGESNTDGVDSSGAGTSGTDSIGEPEYGVPETGFAESGEASSGTAGSDSVGEPDYGVAETTSG